MIKNIIDNWENKNGSNYDKLSFEEVYAFLLTRGDKGTVEEFFDEAFNIKMTDLVESKNETVIHLVNNIDSLLRESTGLFRQYIIDEFMIPKETDWAQIQSSKKDLDDKIEERYSQMQQSFRELSDLL
jgi:hypothetical protein